jgi:hypothetical protein
MIKRNSSKNLELITILKEAGIFKCDEKVVLTSDYECDSHNQSLDVTLDKSCISTQGVTNTMGNQSTTLSLFKKTSKTIGIDSRDCDMFDGTTKELCKRVSDRKMQTYPENSRGLCCTKCVLF